MNSMRPDWHSGAWKPGSLLFCICTMSNLSPEQARKFVDSIRVNNGGIEDKDRENTPEAVLEALTSVRKQLAASTEM